MSEEEEESGFDVKFYPIRNRNLEGTVQGHSTLLRFILALCIIIAVLVIVDFFGYAFEDVKKLFSSGEVSQSVEDAENVFSSAVRSAESVSMYAGHSISADLTSEMHTRESLNEMLTDGNSDSTSLSNGYFGIDVSHWQQSINWSEVANDTIPARIDFSIVKATQGTSEVDPNFSSNWQQSNDQFELAGAYHFYILTDDPKEQAGNFIDNVSLSQGNLPPILDIELNCSNCDTLSVSADQMISDLKIYLEEVENHFSLKPLIYTNQDFYSNYLTGNFDDYHFWIASYEKTPPAELIGTQSPQSDSTSVPEILIWQFSDYEKLNGITGNVDMNFLTEQARALLQSASTN